MTKFLTDVHVPLSITCTGLASCLMWLRCMALTIDGLVSDSCVREYCNLPGMEGEEGRSSKRSAAAKKPRTKQLLCEQDPEAPGLTLEQRRKIRRHALHF